MKEYDIENTIKARIFNAGLDWVIVWPNQNAASPAALQRLEVSIDRNGRTNPGLSAGAVLSDGFVRILVIVPVGGSTGDANKKADQVAALFPKAATLPFFGGRVIFSDAADVRAGFRDGAMWVVPVIAKYTAIPA
jgi:hypothetical protein